MDTRIARVSAHPVSFAVPPAQQVSLGIGRTVKRDAVLVRVDTEGGATGWGEAHAARAPTAIAELVNTTLAALVTGLDATDTEAVWERVYRMQLASHGAGAAAVIGLSGIDLALWDIKGRLVGKPVHALLDAPARASLAYAGGITLGFQPPADLAAEASGYVARGFRAVKLRLGDGPSRDLARVAAVRATLGDDIDILTDANTGYDLAAYRAVADGLVAARVGWLEEPFPAHDFMSYRAARRRDLVLAAGENHYARFDFERAAEDGVLGVWQPDLSKCGGLTEALRIAALAVEHGIAIHPHTSLTGLNMAASLHFLSVVPNAGYFEADCTTYNPLRDELCNGSPVVGGDGRVGPPVGAGLGVTIDESALAAFAGIAGPGYV
ncbi:MAG: mandelate racemase/muconate lactonizing enzyme family protein [Gammaproteobacteria bacterium]